MNNSPLLSLDLHLPENPRLLQPPKTGNNGGYELFLLGIPAVAIFLIWWCDPSHALDIGSAGVVLSTSVVAALESHRYPPKGGLHSSAIFANPVTVLIACLLLWLLFFPMYLYKRKYSGLKNLLVPGLVLMVGVLLSCIYR